MELAPLMSMNFRPVRGVWLRIIVAVAWGAFVLNNWHSLVFAQESNLPNVVVTSPSDEDDISQAQIEQLVKQLADDNFTARELAKAKLTELGIVTISVLDKSLDNADANVCTQIFEIYSQFALDAESPETMQVVKSLKKLIAQESSRKSLLATQLLESIRELHSERAVKELEQLGAGTILGTYPLNGRTGIEPYYYVEINEGFRGTEKDLVWLQWLNKVELVVLSGPNVSGEWLKYLGLMPGLRKLLLRDTSVVSADLKWLLEIEGLDHLEILYSPIDDKAADILARLSVWQSMRIFGTNISFETGEQLGKRLDGIEFQFGCGGFLGIQSDVLAARTSTVSETSRGGAADRAGIVSGDIITKIEDVPITTFEDIRANLRQRRPGEKVVVELERAIADGTLKTMQFDVILGRQE